MRWDSIVTLYVDGWHKEVAACTSTDAMLAALRLLGDASSRCVMSKPIEGVE